MAQLVMIARAMQTRTPVREKATGMKCCFSRLVSGASKDLLLEAMVNAVVSECLHKSVVKKGAECRQDSEACSILYFRSESVERRWTMHCVGFIALRQRASSLENKEVPTTPL